MDSFCRGSEVLDFEFPWRPFSTGQCLRPKKPENGGQKAVEAGETEGSAAQVVWFGFVWPGANLGK